MALNIEKMDGLKRTDYCGDLRRDDIGRKVTVCGWVQRQRDLGQLIFIDLRDRSGIVQLAFDETTDKEIFEKAFQIRSEYVLIATGEIRERSSINKEIPTGEIEIVPTELKVLSVSETTPFEILESTNVKEELRLKYRYLDLRRPPVQNAIMFRHKVVKCARDYYDENGFVEIETPIMVKSTPEGARDYLVPSRVHHGKFFALPQSPQLYKQLLMLSGFDRYMQVARCFRDEDLRADRQPEFTQIDLEMSFVNEDDVMTMNEGFIKYVFKKTLDIDIPTPFERMPYKVAMERFGSDKPDTRFGLELCDLSDLLTGCEFKVFASALEGGSVRAIKVENAADKLTRKVIDKLTDFVKDYGAKGLAFTRFTADGVASSFEKFLSEAEVEAIHTRLEAKENDVILIVADPKDKVVFAALGALRCEIAKRLDLIDPNKFNFLWVCDFPLFEYSEEEDRYVAMHHPFTHPRMEDIDRLETEPASVLARAYDMVLNGCEIGGGSIRINDPSMQQRMFKALGFTDEDAQERFGFLIDAFKYGAPPHGGMAYGLDRLVMLMLGCESIRDVIAFPKVANSGELMSGAPDFVEQKQLTELSISVTEKSE
ncbi:MAG: aspartate--tRNA ligase [Clostridia bacterium]|nr:aspartate--tRNA ligase [Clostridia bacterium]MBQ5717061.1 aspartate--tRNA ligase [Clostridia bacterium]